MIGEKEAAFYLLALCVGGRNGRRSPIICFIAYRPTLAIGLATLHRTDFMSFEARR